MFLKLCGRNRFLHCCQHARRNAVAEIYNPPVFTKNRTCAIHHVIYNYVTGSGLGQHVFSLRLSYCNIININKLINVLIKN